MCIARSGRRSGSTVSDSLTPCPSLLQVFEINPKRSLSCYYFFFSLSLLTPPNSLVPFKSFSPYPPSSSLSLHLLTQIRLYLKSHRSENTFAKRFLRRHFVLGGFLFFFKRGGGKIFLFYLTQETSFLVSGVRRSRKLLREEEISSALGRRQQIFSCPVYVCV